MRIGVAATMVGLLLCGAFAFAVHKHGESVRAGVQAGRDREDATAAERAVSGSSFVVSMPLAQPVAALSPERA